MKLLQLKCPSCGAKLSVSDHLKSFTCNFCGITTLLDDEVIKVEHSINNIEKDEMYKKVEAYIKLNMFENAEEICDEMIEKYFYDAQTWLYVIAIKTENYNTSCVIDHEELLEYLDTYKRLETDDSKKSFNVNKIEKYVSYFIERHSNIANQSLECPFCGASIKFGQKQCDNCDENLFWPQL